MLSLRPIRRICSAALAISSKTPPSSVSSCINGETKPLLLEEPALIKLKQERDPEKLFHLFRANSHNRLVIENSFAFEDTVARLAGAGRFDYIEQLLEHQKSLPQGRREGFIVRIIMLYGEAGMIRHAVDTFYNMHLYGCKRTVKSLNAVLTVVTQTCDLGMIEQLFQVVKKFGIELDVISVNIVIKALVEMCLMDQAYLMMIQMEELGIKPDVFTYTTLMSAFYKINRWEIGNGLWNLMIHKGCFPNVATFNARIEYLINRRRAWAANDMMLLMRSIGIIPDEITYNLVIKGFFLAGYPEMAKRIYSALLSSHCRPNILIYQTMIHYLCKGGDYSLAYTMSKDCMRNNWFPSLDTIVALLKGLKITLQLGKAKMIMTLVKKRTPPFTSSQMCILESVISKS